MKFHRHFPIMLGEYWIYALAVVILITTQTLLYSQKAQSGYLAGSDSRAGGAAIVER
jgi:hypothetical protein